MPNSVSSFVNKPIVLDIDPNSKEAAQEWKNWQTIFTNYLDDYKDRISNKLRVLVSCVSPTDLEFIESCNNIESALKRLNSIYIKKNQVFVRHLLDTRKQRQH